MASEVLGCRKSMVSQQKQQNITIPCTPEHRLEGNLLFPYLAVQHLYIPNFGMYMTDFYHAIVRSVIQSASMDIVPPDKPVQALGLIYYTIYYIMANLKGVIK